MDSTREQSGGRERRGHFLIPRCQRQNHRHQCRPADPYRHPNGTVHVTN
jgi:hypothetical protein